MAQGPVTAFVGSYGSDTARGGISVVRFDPNTLSLEVIGQADKSLEAGYLVYRAPSKTLYAVDERKTDGRGPVGPAGGVHAFAFDPAHSTLTWQNFQRALGPFPTYLALDTVHHRLLSASHGSFDHIERVVRAADGGWSAHYEYDNSTVATYSIDEGGEIGSLVDVQVLTGHGKDPNFSLQAGGHAQSGPHAHCVAIDPTRRYAVVCDKGTDRMLVYELGDQLNLVSTLALPPETGPRHIAFGKGRRAYATIEFSSELAVLDFDTERGELDLVERVSTVADDYTGPNEPAELRVHPNGRFVYVNNRGEDTFAWFDVSQHARRVGHVKVARSLHPGVAARSFDFDPSGRTILFADRPANLVRLYVVNSETGAPEERGSISIASPAFVAFATSASSGA